jgi:hypothetical protein
VAKWFAEQKLDGLCGRKPAFNMDRLLSDRRSRAIACLAEVHT